MTYVVYGAAGSGSVPVEAALTLLGLAYRVVEAPTWEGDAERDKVAPVNPMRQLPALVTPDGEVLTESAAILIWLADRHSPARRAEAGLAPRHDEPTRGRFLRWMCFVPAAIYSMYWVRDVPERLAGEAAEAQARILERTRDRILECWAVMEAQIEPGRFLLGDTLTVLDLYVATVSRWGPRRAAFRQVAPKMAEVVARIDALPELQAFWAERHPFDPGWDVEPSR